MLMISAAPSSIASSAVRADTIDSSRHTGVADAFASSAWPDDVLLVEGLFDEQQVELVEPAQVLDVDPRVRRVGIDLERHVGTDQLAHETHRLEVPAGLDLELDADIPVVDVALHLAQQPVDGVEDADADAAGDPIAGAAEMGVQAGALGAELGVEHRHLERRLGHRVPLDRSEQSGDLARGDIAGGDEAGEQVRLDHERRGVDVLRRSRSVPPVPRIRPTRSNHRRR